MFEPRYVLNQFSTGGGSAEVARRDVARWGVDRVRLITADTRIEDPDNWRFADEVWEHLGRPSWTIVRDGRNPMEAGRDARCVPNNRMAICSRDLKRKVIRDHLDATYDPAADLVTLGFDWTEEHRMAGSRGPWEPWTIAAPLMDRPHTDKAMILAGWLSDGISPPALYDAGFSHANCGGGCVRGGHAQWALLLRTYPERYAWWENEERISRRMLDKDVTILKDRTGGQTRPITLRAFRERLQATPTLFDHDDWGACGCFMGEDPVDEPIATPVAIGSRPAPQILDWTDVRDEYVT